MSQNFNVWVRSVLSIHNLCQSVNGQTILRSCSLKVKTGTIHALVGANGSGKTTLARAIAGAPAEKTNGSILLHGEKIDHLTPDERARRGIFLSFQIPPAIPGLLIGDLLTQAVILRGTQADDPGANIRLRSALELLSLEKSFLQRPVHETLSGGERKKLELLQFFLAQPALAVLDEIDTGLDNETLIRVASALRQIREKEPARATLVVTHQEQFLRLLAPDTISTMHNGTITTTGANQTATKSKRSATRP